MSDYNNQLQFVKKYFENISVPFHIVNLQDDDSFELTTEFGPHSLVFSPDQVPDYLHLISISIEPKVLYRVRNELLCNYFVFTLDNDKTQVCLIGPYLPAPVTISRIRSLFFKAQLPDEQIRTLKEYYDNLILIDNDAHILAILTTLCQIMWDGFNNYSLRDINNHGIDNIDNDEATKNIAQADSSLIRMRNLSERYHVENLLLEAVAQGEVHRAEMLYQKFSSINSVEPRTTDAVRNIKNYSIILNTLLRKAAEQGKVHPIHLDKASATIAAKIEQTSTTADVQALGKEMVRKYCLLVRNHSMKNYSSIVQQALTIINSDLSAELTLNTLADELHINASYLSAQFKKELGVTLTDYVTQKRINHAIFLINSSDLSVSVIAQRCGIPDLQYFSKIFKKRLGMSPLQYRKMINGNTK